MGVVFCEHLGGSSAFVCDNCSTYLTYLESRISTSFISSTGPAWLFDKVVNITHDEAVEKNMVTGRHIVRNVFCKVCKEKLGWFYEFAYSPSQRYKEGMTILEVDLIREENNDVVDVELL